MKFTPGPAIASASGSIGGTTFSHNRFGAYTRKRSIPTDPNTNRQQQVKSVFAQLSSTWNLTLTQAQRDAWNEYGRNVPRIDSLGQTHYLPGIQWFIGVNTLGIQSGNDIRLNAPWQFNRAELPDVVGIASFETEPTSPGTGSYINLNDGAPLLNLEFSAPVGTGHVILVYLGRPVNPTINFYKAPWRFWTAWSQVAAAQVSIDSSIIGPMPQEYTVGQAAFVRIRSMSVDGRYSPESSYRLPVWDVTE